MKYPKSYQLLRSLKHLTIDEALMIVDIGIPTEHGGELIRINHMVVNPE